MGPGGLHEGQNIIGWQRVPGKTTVSFSVPAEAAGTQTWFDYFSTDPNSQSYKHLLWQSNRVDGRCIAMYFPRLKPTGNVPSQADLDGLNYVPLTFEALPDVDNASTERGRSPIRIAMG